MLKEIVSIVCDIPDEEWKPSLEYASFETTLKGIRFILRVISNDYFLYCKNPQEVYTSDKFFPCIKQKLESILAYNHNKHNVPKYINILNILKS